MQYVVPPNRKLNRGEYYYIQVRGTKALINFGWDRARVSKIDGTTTEITVSSHEMMQSAQFQAANAALSEEHRKLGYFGPEAKAFAIVDQDYHFLEYVRGKRERSPLADADDARYVIAVALAAQQSAREQRKQSIST
jgi:predicted dehydrogenase